MKKTSLFSIMIATVILFSSCATTVSVKKIQPANFDIKDAKSIAILPFETSEPSSLNFSDNINSNEELISIILKCGTKKYSVKTLSMVLLNNIGGICELKNVTYNKLIKIDLILILFLPLKLKI